MITRIKPTFLTFILGVILFSAKDLSAQIVQLNSAHIAPRFEDSVSRAKNFYFNLDSRTPYLFDNWLPVDVVTNDGDIYRLPKAKYDIYKDVLETTLDNITLNVDELRSLILYPQSSRPLIFTSGFPAISNYSENTLFEVVANGNTKLLKKQNKYLFVQQVYSSAVPLIKLNNDISYFIYKNSRIFKLKRSKSFLVNLLSDKRNDISAYLSKNKIQLNSDEDLIKVINYYNSL